ncbi:MAG: hypothetical protein ACRDSZ_16400 [Pseudonocardiaceae bacterium]
MSDTLSFAEFDGQHVELLAARTVLSMFSAVGEGIIPGGDKPLDLVTKVAGLSSSTTGSNGGGESGASSS